MYHVVYKSYISGDVLQVVTKGKPKTKRQAEEILNKLKLEGMDELLTGYADVVPACELSERE